MAKSHPARSAKAIPPSNPFRAFALPLLGIATLISAWLAWRSLNNAPVPGCDGGDCGAVLGSKWAKAFGVPVGFFGAAAYLVLAILGARPFPPGDRLPRVAAGALALLIPAAAVWFAALQFLVLKAFCPWCSGTHAVATAGAVALVLAWRRDVQSPAVNTRKGRTAAAAPPFWAASIGWAVLAFGGFLVAQVFSPEPPTPRLLTASMSTEANAPTNALASGTPAVPATVPNSLPSGAETAAPPAPATASVAAPAPGVEKPRTVTLHGGRFSLDVASVPLVGRPDARHLFVMISDYTCIHCRQANRILHGIRDAFPPEDLAYLSLPTQHGGNSLEIQRTMLATWKVDPLVWQEIGHEIYADRLPPDPVRIRTVLDQRVGADRLDESLRVHSTWISDLLDTTKRLLVANRERTASGSIPQFIIGSEIVVGAPKDAGEFFQLFEKNLGLVRDRFPELRLATDEIDLGRIFAGTVRPLTLGFTNTGVVPLVVSGAALPPGSRVVSGLDTPVPPGQSAALELGLAVPREPGPLEHTVTIFSNSRESGTPLHLKANVFRPVEITPSMLEFGRLDADHSSTQGVLRVAFAEPVRVAGVRSPNPGFRAAFREVEPGKVYEVDVSTTAALGIGLQRGAILVDFEKPVPEGWPDSLALGVRAQVERAVVAIPARLVLPAATLTTDRHHQVLVRCSDGSPNFEVTGAVIEGGPAFTQPEVQRGGGPQDFVVRLTLPAGWTLPPPAANPRVIVHTTHPRYTTVDVPLVAAGQ